MIGNHEKQSHDATRRKENIVHDYEVELDGMKLSWSKSRVQIIFRPNTLHLHPLPNEIWRAVRKMEDEKFNLKHLLFLQVRSIPIKPNTISIAPLGVIVLKFP